MNHDQSDQEQDQERSRVSDVDEAENTHQNDEDEGDDIRTEIKNDSPIKEKNDTPIEQKDDAREQCKSPTEGSYGDDESKKHENEEEPRNKRRTKRNVRVEEENESDVLPRRPGRLNRQSSSEDEVGRANRRSSSGLKTLPARRVSSSEDEVASSRRKPSLSKKSISDRKASFEHSSGSEQISSEKRTSFSGRRAQTIATSGQGETRRQSFGKSRAMSVEYERKHSSADKPGWSSSTKVEHGHVTTNTMNRKESTTHSESEDHQQSATQLRIKWERKRSDSKSAIKTKAFGGQEGAAAIKARFEAPRSGYQGRKSSSSGKSRAMSTDSEDGAPKKVSASALKARFEAKNTESNAAAPVRRNFVINKNRTGAAAKKFNASGPTSNKCLVCSKTVYPLEKLEADGKLYHKFCFKCATCNRTVGLGNFAALQGKIYCKPHLKQLFKLKGNYDEGFGREQRKADWVKKDKNAVSSNPEASDVSDIAVQNDQTDEEVLVNGSED